ncbi:MAG TPA: hypothetical protein VF598_08180 [Hymenobacter sp.]
MGHDVIHLPSKEQSFPLGDRARASPSGHLRAAAHPGHPLGACPYEQDLLECFVQGDLTLDQVEAALDQFDAWEEAYHTS